MKVRKILHLICALFLIGCVPSFIDEEEATFTIENTPMPSSTSLPPFSSITPTQAVTVSATPYSKIIDETNLERLALLRQWDVDDVYFTYQSGNFWFSDSNQFILPLGAKSPTVGLQAFDVNKPTPLWSYQSLQSDFTINDYDQVILNLEGLTILDTQGIEIRTIRTNKMCDFYSKPSVYILTITGSDLVITGQQDSYSDEKARLLIWDTNKNSCTELIEQFDGFLSSLSASDDGHYISYSTVQTTIEPPKFTTMIYDLDLRKEKCELDGGFLTHFTAQGQLIVYDTGDDGTFSLIKPTDCTTERDFNAGTEILNAFAISPSGELLAGITDHALHFWDVKTGEKLHVIEMEEPILNIIGFSPNGQFLVISKDIDSYDQVMLFGIPDEK
jgi:hypothetical protein